MGVEESIIKNIDHDTLVPRRLISLLSGEASGNLSTLIQQNVISPEKGIKEFRLVETLQKLRAYRIELQREKVRAEEKSIVDLDRKKKQLEIEKLEIANTKAKGEVIPVEDAAKICMEWQSALRNELVQLLTIEWPVSVANREIAEIREKGQKAVNTLCERLNDTIEKLQALECGEESEPAGPTLTSARSTSGHRTISRSRRHSASQGGSTSRYRATSSTSSKRSNRKQSAA